MLKFSTCYIRTLREDPQEAETISHRLMIRAGLVKKIATGIYAYLPLGLKVLHHIMQVIREELDSIGCNELLLPALIPSDPWKKTGRWDLYGKEMFRLSDRTDRSFCLGPTHEEVVTEVVKNDIRSYRDLPVFVYQIQTKYRDELRPRFGVVRAKEFIMKDLYSFHEDMISLENGYQKIYEAYQHIFRRCSIDFTPVEADNGAIGGAYSHEFVAKTPIGETSYVLCNQCGYAANLEAAKSRTTEETKDSSSPDLSPEEVYTPNKKTITDVAAFLDVEKSRILKTLCYRSSSGKKMMVVVCGDDEVNEAKLKKIVGTEIEWNHDDQELMGFVGPAGLKGVLIVADERAKKVKNAVCGANKPDYHTKNINYETDWKAQLSGDIRLVKDMDGCPRCEGYLGLSLGMELGHTFVLNDRYTKPLGVQFAAVSGKMETVLMGCYGIGVSRLIAALIEQHHDEKGIAWPVAMAPYQVAVISLQMDSPEHLQAAESISKELYKNRITHLWDDRPLSPGVKFKDAELIGFPFAIVLGKWLAEGLVEIKVRKSGETIKVPLNNVVEIVRQHIEKG